MPSQIVEYIDTSFDKGWFQRGELALGAEGAVACVMGLLSLVERVPEHLLTLGREDAAQLITSLAAMRAGVYRAQNLALNERQQAGVPPLKPTSPSGQNPIEIVRKSFAKCSDEAPHPKTPGLSFINDPELNASVRSDLDQAYRALEGDQWKSAVVMGGAVLEALLLWALQEPWSSNIAAAAAKRKLSPPPEKWGLADYVQVATEAQIINEETRKQCELCKDFRNLIHPGRGIRLLQKPTRGRALGALAAVELVIESLS